MSRIKERIENFKRAFNILKKSVEAYNNDKENEVIHMALIQSFEITFELSWKILKDYLELKEIIVKFPRDVIKEGFSFDVIENGQLWIDMLADRNISSHEYNMDKTGEILEKISTVYLDELTRFSNWMNEIND